MATATCATCGVKVTRRDVPGLRPWQPTATALQDHHDREHLHRSDEIAQPPALDWQDRALDVIRTAAATGQDFTIFAVLAEAGLESPPDAKTANGRLAHLVHDMGIAHPVRYERSRRDGTRSSAVAVWHRDAARCLDHKTKGEAA